ncbi:hypothetical protein ACOME3_004452 [Neoechinorhynchus agilis]
MDQQEAEVRKIIESSNHVSGSQHASYSSNLAPTSYQYSSEYMDTHGGGISGFEGSNLGINGFEGNSGAGEFGSSMHGGGTFDSATFGVSSGGTVGGFESSQQYESAGFESSQQYGESGYIGGQETFSTGEYGSGETVTSFGGSGGGAIGAYESGINAIGANASTGVDFGGYNAVDQNNSTAYSNYKIQQDPNPTVVKRQFTATPQVYRQHVQVRFLKPPQLPAPGPLIVREVRPPQPPPAPPLIIRQRPPRPPTPPPIILREKPPRPPASLSQKVIIKRLAALPPPPRQVIIERYPPLPPKPRDIIIERWLPYGPMPKRRVIYQRAAGAQVYKTAKNMIICYETIRPRVERAFKNLGITQMDPRSYVERYGGSLLDAHILISQARNYGVTEDISPPAIGYGAYGMESSSDAAPIGGLEAAGFAETSYHATGSTEGYQYNAMPVGEGNYVGGSAAATDINGVLANAGLDASAFDVVSGNSGLEGVGGESHYSEQSSFQQFGGAMSSGFDHDAYHVESAAGGGFEGGNLMETGSYTTTSESIHGI